MLLAIDTATRNLSLAVHDGEQLVAEFTWRSADYHTVELTPLIAAGIACFGSAIVWPFLERRRLV